MTSFPFAQDMRLALEAGAWLAAGTLIGAFHFLTLRWNVGMLVAGQARRLALAVQLGRFALLAGALSVIAGRFGALPLLSCAAGIVLSRTAMARSGART